MFVTGARYQSLSESVGRHPVLSGDRQEVCDRIASLLSADRAVGGATLDAKLTPIHATCNGATSASSTWATEPTTPWP